MSTDCWRIQRAIDTHTGRPHVLLYREIIWAACVYPLSRGCPIKIPASPHNHHHPVRWTYVFKNIVKFHRNITSTVPERTRLRAFQTSTARAMLLQSNTLRVRDVTVRQRHRTCLGLVRYLKNRSCKRLRMRSFDQMHALFSVAWLKYWYKWNGQ